MLQLRYTPKRVLDFDVECRPLSWYGGDFVTKEITAIAWAEITKRPQVNVVLLGAYYTPEDVVEVMLQPFLEAYDKADIVTGHYIRGFDLPLINGALIEHGLQPLSAKLTQDTKLDLLRFQGLSKSQENLGALLGLRHPKVGMNQRTWREANRLTVEGLALTRKRVEGDVRQHIEMRQRMLDQGLLAPPKLWAPGGDEEARYEA